MTHPHPEDERLTEALREVAPSREPDLAGLEHRIAATIEAAGPTRLAVRGGSRIRALVWAGRLAAAVTLFVAGVWYGRLAPPGSGLPIDAVPSAPAPLASARVALLIQSAGTGYIAALARLSELQDQLTPEQREQAREVALAVLSGAIAELGAAEDPTMPGMLLRTLRASGVPAGGPGTPVVRYQ